VELVEAIGRLQGGLAIRERGKGSRLDEEWSIIEQAETVAEFEGNSELVEITADACGAARITVSS
jgi:hypothetical protein